MENIPIKYNERYKIMKDRILYIILGLCCTTVSFLCVIYYASLMNNDNVLHTGPYHETSNKQNDSQENLKVISLYYNMLIDEEGFQHGPIVLSINKIPQIDCLEDFHKKNSLYLMRVTNRRAVPYTESIELINVNGCSSLVSCGDLGLRYGQPIFILRNRNEIIVNIPCYYNGELYFYEEISLNDEMQKLMK